MNTIEKSRELAEALLSGTSETDRKFMEVMFQRVPQHGIPTMPVVYKAYELAIHQAENPIEAAKIIILLLNDLFQKNYEEKFREIIASTDVKVKREGRTKHQQWLKDIGWFEETPETT